MHTPAIERPSRERVTTIRSDGTRAFLYPADTRGRFTMSRRAAGILLIAFYVLLPWVRINGYPAVFLDVADQRFHLFGLTLAAQDMWLMFFVISGLGFSLFFVTALFGRIWCGWACPQTVFLDHVYRWIERRIDGDAIARRALHDAPLSRAKIVKRVSKHLLYILVAIGVTHLFLSYFVSLPRVWSMIAASPARHWGAFAFIVVSTGLLYFDFAWFREQLCIVICPYGRIQSALIDADTLVIGYDSKRGEPRGRVGTSSGDCVDCSRCVQVCPTGIDIRQGLQLECIGCTACIDACDAVMKRLGRSPGLIRYDSQAGFSGARTRWVRPRTILYSLLLLAGAAVASWGFSTVKPASFNVTRMTGAPYIVDATSVRNQFLVRIVNKQNEARRFVVHVRGAPRGTDQLGFGAPVAVDPLSETVEPLILRQSRSDYSGPFHFTVRVEDAARTYHIDRDAEFVGPDAALLRADDDRGSRH